MYTKIGDKTMKLGNIKKVNFTGAARFKEDVPIERLQELLTNNHIANDTFDERDITGKVIPRSLGEPTLLATENEVRIFRESKAKGRLVESVKIQKKIYKVSEVLKAAQEGKFDLINLKFKNIFQILSKK